MVNHDSTGTHSMVDWYTQHGGVAATPLISIKFELIFMFLSI